MIVQLNTIACVVVCVAGVRLNNANNKVDVPCSVNPAVRALSSLLGPFCRWSNVVLVPKLTSRTILEYAAVLNSSHWTINFQFYFETLVFTS